MSDSLGDAIERLQTELRRAREEANACDRKG